jgi:hypothetical protein
MPNVFLPRAAALAALLSTLSALAACHDTDPAETVTATESFPQTAAWSTAVAPIGPSTVRGTVAVKQFAGFRMSATITLTGAPNTTYQWRVFRDPCAQTAAAQFPYSSTGLVLVSTNQSYTDVRTDASGNGTVTATVTGSLDSLTKYSARVRPSQTSITWNGTSPIACGDLQRTAGAG